MSPLVCANAAPVTRSSRTVHSTRCLASSLFLRFVFPEGIFRILKFVSSLFFFFFSANARITYISSKALGCLGYYTLEFHPFAEFPVRRYAAEDYFLKRYPLEYRSLERSIPTGYHPSSTVPPEYCSSDEYPSQCYRAMECPWNIM